MAVLTKAQQVERYLRNAIQSGHWEAGQALPPEYDLLEQFRVSRATIREALNTLANDGLVVRKQGSGTYVTENANTGIVAILGKSEVVSTQMGFVFRRLVDETRERIERAGYRAVLAVTHGESADEMASSTQILDKPGSNGVLGVFNTAMGATALNSRLADSGIATVAFSGNRPDAEYSVVLDYQTMAHLAVEALNAQGYEDFALMYISDQNEYLERIPKGFDKIQMEAVKHREDRLVPVPRSINYREAYDVFKDWWARKDRPNAMFFFDDALCDVSTRAILELGIKVPEELAIITQAIVGRTFHFPIPITRVEFDAAEVADEAWKMLHMLIKGETVDSAIVYIKPRLKRGGSLGETGSEIKGKERLAIGT